MKKLLLCLTCLVFGFNGQSQGTNFQAGSPNNFRFHSFQNTNLLGGTWIEPATTRKIIDDSNTTGSRFTSDFQPGKVIGYNQEYLLRYDAFNDEMQIEKVDGSIAIIDKKTINQVNLGDGSIYKIFNYDVKKENITGYLKVLFTGEELSLLKKEVIAYEFEKKPESGYHDIVPAAYVKGNEIYFIADHSGEIRSFRNKKDLLNLYPTHKKSLENFMKVNNIRFSKEDSLSKLAQHLDMLN